MRKYSIILAAAAILSSLVACTKQDFNDPKFVVLGNKTYTVEENVGVLKIPVYNNKAVATTVSFKAVDATATAGTFFNLENKTGVINFKEGQKTDTIVVNILPIDGYTGNTKFDVKIESATNGVAVGGANTCTVTIKDLDHPLSAFFGEYTMQAVSINTSQGLSYYKWTMEMVADPDNVDNVICDYMCYFAYYYEVEATLVGTVSEDRKSIVFTLPQVGEEPAEDFFSGNMGNFAYYGSEADGTTPITKDFKVTFTLDEESGKWITTDNFQLNSVEYAKTADWLYYMMTNYSTFNAGYPTYFVKN